MLIIIFQVIAMAGLLAGLYGIYLRYAETKRRVLPADKSPLKGSPQHGITYAFTLGMMPWAKESTRIHMIAYLRGIGFHIGIFAALSMLIISPFWGFFPNTFRILMACILFMGALLGAAGGVMRIFERNLRGLSLPDDHFAIWLTTLFITVTAFGILNEAMRIPMYIVATITFVYVPLGKIRHCLYFFFSRTFFGKFFGRRAVFPHPESIR
jgi:nitrate reductase gamma subunit